MSFDAYLKDAASDGEFDSASEFTIDPLRADQKLAEFYRSQPGLWLLKFVQAAITVQAQSIKVRAGHKTTSVTFVTPATPPSLADFLAGDEYNTHLRTAVRAAVAVETDLKDLVITAHHADTGTVQTLQFSKQTPPKLSELSAGPMKENQVSVHFERESVAWWKALKHRIIFQANLHKLCQSRLRFTPIPIQLDGLKIGLGLGQAYPGIGSEYLVGPLTEDTVVRELEPGNGSVRYEVFGKQIGDLGPHPRVFTRWAQVESPLFPAAEQAVVQPLKEVGNLGSFLNRTLIGSPHQQKKQLPPNSIPIFRMKSVLSFKIVAAVEINPLFRPPAKSADTPGLPVHVMLTVPQKPKGRSVVTFLRRGVLLEALELDLGCPGATALVCCPALKTDMTDFRVVKDERFEELLDFLRDRVRQLAIDTVKAAQAEKRTAAALEKFVQQYYQ